MAAQEPDQQLSNVAMGRRIRSMRETRGLTREDLAYFAGITKEALRAIEVRGTEPKFWTAYRIAKVLNVKMEALVGEAPPKAESVEVAVFPRRHVRLLSTSTSSQLAPEDVPPHTEGTRELAKFAGQAA